MNMPPTEPLSTTIEAKVPRLRSGQNKIPALLGFYFGSAGNRTPVSKNSSRIVYKLIRPRIDETV